MTDRFPKGLELRKKVLGEAHVERSMANTNKFMMPMQEFTTESCWGTGWSRPGLPMKTRSMLCIALLTALNRQHELGMHVAAALDNGCTVSEVQEVLQVGRHLEGRRCNPPSAATKGSRHSMPGGLHR